MSSRRFALAAAAFLALSGFLCGVVRAQGNIVILPGEDERLIVYGGLGSLQNDPQFQAFARKYDLHKFAREKISGFPIGKTSVATSSREVLAELTRRDGSAASSRDIQDAIETGLLYVTTFVSSFQYRVVSEDFIDGGNTKSALYLATATLVVSRAEDDVVIFAVPVTSIGKGAVDRNGNGARPDDEIFAELYRKAIPEALQTVTKIVSRFSEPDFDHARSIVVAVHGGDPSLRQAFGIKDQRLNIATVFCKGATASPGSGELWRLLTSFIAQSVTSKLAGNGIAVVPPANWNAWTHSASNVTGTAVNKIAFSTIGGLRELNDKIELKIDPAEIDRKLIVEIGQLMQNDIKLDGVNRVFYRTYRTPVRVSWFENPSRRECGRISGKGVLYETRSPKYSKQTRMMADYGKPPSLREQANFAWVAIMNALADLDAH